MANVADIVLKVSLNGVEGNLGKMEEILLELEELSYGYYDNSYNDDEVAEIFMGGRWSAPIDDFQNICNRYGCSIIGVVYDLGVDHVDSFEIYSDLPVEDSTNHFISAVASDDTQTSAHVEGDDNFLTELV